MTNIIILEKYSVIFLEIYVQTLFKIVGKKGNYHFIIGRLRTL